MSGNKPEQEPSIEEILASIRQIISDDDGDQNAAGVIDQPVEEKFDIPVYNPPAEKNAADDASFKDVLDLTNEIGAGDDKVFDLSDTKFDIPVHEPVRAEPQSRQADVDLSFNTPSSMSAPSSQDDIDSLFSTPAASATTEAFSRLLGNIPVEREENQRMYADGRITLEDIAKDLLRPMLRQWVDDNVPALVERLVEKELEKLARQAR